jgi:3-polyprenyl-4-hydroxybenzoate decarboxylase
MYTQRRLIVGISGAIGIAYAVRTLELLRLLDAEAVTEAGAIVLPPAPAFHLKPYTIDEIVHHTVARMLDLFGLDAALALWARERMTQILNNRVWRREHETLERPPGVPE